MYVLYSLQKVGKMSLGGVSNIVGRPDNEQQQHNTYNAHNVMELENFNRMIAIVLLVVANNSLL